MLKKFFSQFIDPMAIDDTSRPPAGVVAFFSYYLKPIRWFLVALLITSGIATVSELMLYVYLGDIVDWMGEGNTATFMEDHKTALIWMLVVAVVIRPISLLASRGLIMFSLVVGLGNRIRWHNHRYVLRQSLSYFQNDFAGRISQKVMQTGQSAREAVLNVIDGVWLLLVYLIGIAWLFVDMDWRLLLPLILWIIGYIMVIVFLVPSVRGRSAALSEANSQLLGQVVDGYTNIQSVKLFATTDQEDAYAGKFMRRHTSTFRDLLECYFQYDGDPDSPQYNLGCRHCWFIYLFMANRRSECGNDCYRQCIDYACKPDVQAGFCALLPPYLSKLEPLKMALRPSQNRMKFKILKPLKH